MTGRRSSGWSSAFDAAVAQGSKRHIRALLGVSGGSVTRLRRKDDRLDHWRIKIQPSSHGAVTVTLSPSPACGATGAVCTPDGRTYTTALATRIQGPPGLAVADAEVEEGPNASLAFAVTLSRAPSGTVTVDYATSDGTATAGSDYTAASGTLTFAAGETEKTVSVAVLDDAHDEGSETLGLTLSNASGAHIADGSATGTINNTDHMPQAWLARFGRTVADQVVDAVGERLRGPGGAGAEVRVAGQDLSGATPDGEATREAEAQARIESLAKWLRGESGRGPPAVAVTHADEPGLPDRHVVRAHRRHGADGLRVAVGPGRAHALRRSRGRAHARRRGGERDAGRGLDAGPRHGGGCGGAQPRRGRIPLAGGERRGRGDADRTLSLRALCGGRAALGVGRARLRFG